MFRPFGSTAAPATPFGTPQPQSQTQVQPTSSGGFGFGGSTFGASNAVQPAPSAFGTTATSGGFGTGGSFGAAATRPRHSMTADMEGDSKIYLHHICAMPAYVKLSPEELRLEDYLAGRKGGAPFGAIGQPVPPQNVFGPSASLQQQQQQQQQPSGVSAFGAVPATANLFGANNAAPGGLFGAPKPLQQQQSTYGSFGSFGQPPQQNMMQQPQQTMMQQPQQPSSSLFGGSGVSSGSFGATTAPQSNLFGAPQSQFGAFNKPATQPAPNTFGGFGGALPQQQQQQQQQQAPSSSLFGAPPAPGTTSFGFGQPATAGGLFGAKPATTATNAGFGGFNAPAPATTATPSLFGMNNAPPGGNLFGLTAGAQPAQPAQQSSGFSLGAAQPTATQAQQSSGLFGNGRPATANAPGGFSFNFAGANGPSGGQSTGMGNFGTSTGAANYGTTPGTFGTNAPTQSLTQPPSSGFSFNLGGGASSGVPMAPSGYSGGSMFSGSGTGIGGSGGGLLQLQSTQSQALPMISAESLSIHPPLPVALTTPKAEPSSSNMASTKLTSSTQRSPHRHTPRASFRLSAPSDVAAPAPAASSFGSFSTGSSSGFVLPRRVCAKKLVIESDPGLVVVPGSRFANLSRASSQAELRVATDAAIPSSSPDQSLLGDKYLIPSEATLRKLPYAQLCAVHNFTIGERGIGQVRFLQPVDLTKIVLSDIFDRIVVFEPRLVTLYPDDEFSEEEKPSVGSGLNVPAEVRLERCWCVSKADRQPVKDMGDARLQAHIERLKSMEDTKFVDYLPETGTWIFRVDHFSSYGPEFECSPLSGEGPSAVVAPKTLEWQHLALGWAKQALDGEARRFSVSWTLSGSHLVTRNQASTICFYPTPSGPLRCGHSLEAFLLASPQGGLFKKDLTNLDAFRDLISALRGPDQRQETIEWLLTRIHRPKLDPVLWSLVTGKYPSVVAVLDAVGLERLSIMAGLKAGHQVPQIHNHTVVLLASMQLEHASPSSPLIERFVLSVIAGTLNPLAFPTIPWEACLLACLYYPPRSLSQAVAVLVHPVSLHDDPMWHLIALYSTQDSEHLSALANPFDGYDWSLPYLLLQLIAPDFAVSPAMIHHCKRQLGGQLLAMGEWHIGPALLPSFDVGPFMRLDFANRLDAERYQVMLDFAIRLLGADQVRVANGRLLRHLQQPLAASRVLVQGGAFDEAFDLVRPLVIEAFLAGSTGLSLLEGIPNSQFDTLVKSIVRVWSGKGDEPQEPLDCHQYVHLGDKVACQLIQASVT